MNEPYIENDKTPNTGDDLAAFIEHDVVDFLINCISNNARNPCKERWRAAASLLVLRKTINENHPNRNKIHDGIIGDERHCAKNSDHVPWVLDGTVGVVTAIDITHDPHNDCDCNKICASLVRSKDSRIKYIIWNKRICSSVIKPWKWRTYTGDNPHSTHVHISVKCNKSTYDSKEPWSID